MINLSKGETGTLKFDELPTNRITIGVGWNPRYGDSIDLDMGLVQLDANGNVLDILNFRKTSKSLSDGSTTYSGDDTTGESSKGGYDEKMWTDFSRVRQDCAYMVCVINSYRGQTFNDVSGTLFGVGYPKPKQQFTGFFSKILSTIIEPTEDVMLYTSKFNDNDSSTGIATTLFKRIDQKTWGINMVWEFVNAKVANDIPANFFKKLISK